MTTKREGDPGTFSACGNPRPHLEHRHDFAMNEGWYREMHCRGRSYLDPTRAADWPGDLVATGRPTQAELDEMPTFSCPCGRTYHLKDTTVPLPPYEGRHRKETA